jgi:hypothetical protein
MRRTLPCLALALLAPMAQAQGDAVPSFGRVDSMAFR